MKPSKRLVKWTLIIVAVPAAIFGSLAYLAARNRPHITRNYAAELNAPILAVPEAQRAWPIYREALLDLAVNEPAHWIANDHQAERVVHVKEVIDYLDRQQPTLRRVRAAAKLPSLGYALADELPPEDWATQRRRAIPGSGPPPPSEPPSENPWLCNIVCNACDHTGELSYVLTAHALVSAKRGDTAAAVDDIEAMLRIAQQIRETPFLINDLSSLRQFRLALKHWGRLLEQVPDTFTAEQLLRLERAAKAFGDGTPLVRNDGERRMFADTAQRFFTDDGHGDGHGCYADILDIGRPQAPGDYWKSLLKPKPASHSWSRRRNVEEGEYLFALVEAELKRPYWECDCGTFELELTRRQHIPELGFAWTLIHPVNSLHADQQDTVQQRDAILTASALVRYRLDHKSWPERLDALVPRYLAEIPPDQFTGKPLSYRLVDGAPRIYSVGFDKQDDRGVAAQIGVDVAVDGGYTTEQRPWHMSFVQIPKGTKGDLILWPVGPPATPLDPEPAADAADK